MVESVQIRSRLIVVVLFGLTLVACTSVKGMRASNGVVVRDNPRVLLMPPDVLIMEISTAGVPIPRADWSNSAEQSLLDVTASIVSGRAGTLVPYQRPQGVKAQPIAENHLAAVRLYQVVLSAILTYRYQGGPKTQRPRLATKGDDGLDWTLGKTVAPLHADYDADYALFLTYREAASNSGRAMLTAAAFALFGQISTTSQSLALASLVDLHSGEVVWTSLLSGSTFEVGEPEVVHKKVRKLLKDWPL